MNKTKVYYLLLAIVAVLMSGCKSSAEDLITDELREYVRNNFDDPNTFKEVVSIEPIDTLSNERIIKHLTSSLQGSKETNELLDSIREVSMNDEEFKQSLTLMNESNKYQTERYLEKMVSAMIFDINEKVEMESLNSKMTHIIANADSLPKCYTITYKIKYRVTEGDKTTLAEMFAVVDETKNKDNIEFRPNTLRMSESPEHINNIFNYLERYIELYGEKSEKYLDEHRSYKELKELL